jgi:hypothetical protein
MEQQYLLCLFKVTSVIFLGHQSRKAYQGSIDELEANYRQILRHNLLLGWWSLPGLVMTPIAIYRNIAARRELHRIASAENNKAKQSLAAICGGYYAEKNKDGGYYVIRILDINNGVAHQTIFGPFDHIPKLDDITRQTTIVMHTPVDLVGTLRSLLHPDTHFIGKKPLTREDLDGYAVYLAETMEPNEKMVEEYFARHLVGKNSELHLSEEDIQSLHPSA